MNLALNCFSSVHHSCHAVCYYFSRTDYFTGKILFGKQCFRIGVIYLLICPKDQYYGVFIVVMHADFTNLFLL